MRNEQKIPRRTSVSVENPKQNTAKKYEKQIYAMYKNCNIQQLWVVAEEENKKFNAYWSQLHSKHRTLAGGESSWTIETMTEWIAIKRRKQRNWSGWCVANFRFSLCNHCVTQKILFAWRQKIKLKRALEEIHKLLEFCYFNWTFFFFFMKTKKKSQGKRTQR